MSTDKIYKRYVIEDQDDDSEAYRLMKQEYEDKNIGLLRLSGVSGNHPLDLTQKELLNSFRCLKVLYCMREVHYQKALKELAVYKSAQMGRRGFLKELGAGDLDPWVFIRLIVLRFNDLSDEELAPLIQFKPSITNYLVKNLSSDEFEIHLKKASSLAIGMNPPRRRSPRFMFALKVISIGVLEDYLKAKLDESKRFILMTQTDDRLKELLKTINNYD